jgi:tetratricopeptide (TPR) repeat protein
MSETVLQEGNVGDLPLIDLILTARGGSAPTIVELERGKTVRRFYFRDGDLVAFTTTNPKESLPEFLVRRKKLQSAVAASVLQVAAADGLTAAQVILRDRMLPTPDLVSELGAWASLLLVQAFSWDDGQYRVLVESNAPPPETLLEVSLPTVLAQGVWKKMPVEAVRQYMEPYLDLRATVPAELPFPLAEFRLTPDKLRVFELLQSTGSVRGAIEGARLPDDEALRLVFLLHRSGMVELLPGSGVEDEDEDDGFGAGFDADGFDPDDFDFDVMDGGPTDPGMPAAPAPPKPDIAAWLAASGEFEPAAPPAPSVPASSPVSPAPVAAPRPVVAPSSPAPSAPGDLGVDLSAIGFRGGGSGRGSSTMHVGGAGGREEFSAPAPPRRGPDPAPSTGGGSPRSSGLAGLFDGVDLSAGGGRPVVPPRGGRGVVPPGGRSVTPPRGATTAAVPTPEDLAGARIPVSPRRPIVPPKGAAPLGTPAGADEADADAPPGGPGPIIERAEWQDLPTKEKDRIRGLREMLREYESQNYFEMFELSEEATPGLIKKAYFKLARRFHPDALVDEGPIYARLAEAVFAKVSEAYEVLGEDETREKYIAKYIRGEKDENELAMEKVQQILGAESAYKAGVRLMNQGKAVPAVDKLEEAVRLYDEEPEYRGWLGYALFRANQAADYERALAGEEMLQQAIVEKPLAADLPHLMAKIAIMRKDWGNARMWLRKSLKINADNPEALREYKRVDDMIKGVGVKQEDAKGLKGLFGRFGKK